ncbi:MAG: lysophospholipid acyltransferase family protein [Anaerolineae bacterium]|jgi:1-acyl-sn-glycerol-3-phosphate acyltransferase
MTTSYRLVTASIKTLARALCRVDDGQLARVPSQGPLILVGNHVNFLEAPVLYTHLQPRPLAGFAKAETWDNPALGFLADLWGAIPLRRGEMDIAALRQALRALEAGRILGVAPEGTRSGDGRLQAGHPGIVVLALRSNAPLQPVVTYGGERFWPNLTRLRRTDFAIVAGRPFQLAPPTDRVTHLVRQKMIDEIMYQMAALLPPAYRGVYADLSAATETYLRFPPGSESNLRRARDSR